MVSPSDYDALADLFLAGGGLAPDAGIAGSNPAQSHAGGTITMVAPLSEPYRGPSRSVDASSAPLDNITAPRPTFIEGVLLGHLPVFAAGWVSQYAKRLSEERREPVTLIRTHGGEGGRCEIDLVGSLASRPPESRPESIGEALAAGARASHSWILRVDEPNETTLATLEGVDRLTILTGADDVALAATYRTLKFLVTKFRAASIDLDSESLASRLRVMVMGSPDEKAAAAQEKLRSMMAAFLDAPIEVLVGPQRVSPTLMSSLFRDATPMDLPSLISQIRSLPRETPTTATRIGPARTHATQAAEMPEPPMVQTARAPAIEPKPLDQARARSAGAAPAPATRPAASPATTDTSPAHPLELVHHIPGLHKLPVSCPYVPEAEIAADDSGTLHLLAQAKGDVSPGDVIARLVSTTGWLADHLPLIRLALPQTKLAQSSDDVSLHLFTDQPKAVRRLLDSGVRVHLLASVQVGGALAWVCRELN